MKLTQALWVRAKQVTELVRLKPFNVSTPEGRSKERYRRIALTAFASAATKGLSLLTGLILVPLTVHYLGAERYGLWTTISSLVAILGFADLGMANGLLNAVAEAHGRDDRQLAHQYVSSAFFMLAGIAGLLALLFGLAYPWLPWKDIFKVTSPRAVAEAGPAMAVFMACFLVNIPLSIVQQVRLAYQEGFVNGLWQTGGNLLGFGGALAVIYRQADLSWLVLALAGFPIISSIANGVELFWFRRPWLRPHWKHAQPAAARHVLRIGSLFLALQVAGALGYQSDNVVIAQIMGADQVTQYAVPMRLFALAGLALSFFLTPLWPAYGEAIARRDLPWVRRTMKRSILLGLALNVPAAIFLTVFGRTILYLWVGPAVTPSFVLLFGLGLWVVFTSLSGPFAVFLNGANVVGFQVVCSLLMGVSNLGISILLVRHIGIAGAIYGSLIAQSLFIIIPSAIYVSRLLSTLSAPAGNAGA